jgi:hypothetical protein
MGIEAGEWVPFLGIVRLPMLRIRLVNCCMDFRRGILPTHAPVLTPLFRGLIVVLWRHCE